MNKFEAERRFAQRMKDNYPPSTRIMLLQMGDDPRPVEPNTRGTVEVVDDMGTLHCIFDNGRQLGIVPGEDSFRRLTDQELAEEKDSQKRQLTEMSEDELYERDILYEWSLEDAVRNNERDLWRESYKENCDCARAIERAISKNYYDNVLHDCVKPIIDRYGYDRVNFVLANTVQQNKEDGRFSEDNKKWAKLFHIPRDDVRSHFCVESHPGLTNLFINDARKEWQSLDLFRYSHCIPEDDGQIDYTGKIVVLKPTTLKDGFKTPESQLFFATDGNGCRPNAIGTKVYGFHLDNGEKNYYRRYDIIGAIKAENIPDWAKENLAKFRHIETQNDEETPTEDSGMTMDGM